MRESILLLRSPTSFIGIRLERRRDKEKKYMPSSLVLFLTCALRGEDCKEGKRNCHGFSPFVHLFKRVEGEGETMRKRKASLSLVLSCFSLHIYSSGKTKWGLIFSVPFIMHLSNGEDARIRKISKISCLPSTLRRSMKIKKLRMKTK